MADPPAPAVPTSQDISNMDAYGQSARGAAESINQFNGVGEQAKSLLGALYSKIESTTEVMKRNGQTTQDQAAVFGMLTTSLIGTRKAFDNLGSGIDTTGLDTFTKQWSDMEEILKGSAVGQALKTQQTALSNYYKKTITDQTELTKKLAEVSEMTITQVSKLGKSLMESADNGVRLQNAMVQLAARTGNLDKIFMAAGPGLKNMNQLLADQDRIIQKSAVAFKMDRKDVEAYWAQLGTIPQTLEQNVKGSNAMGTSVSMLTATMQFAKGSGRAFSDVVEDLKVAFTDYNLKGEDALKFTARMGELANNFDVDLKDVQSSLRGTADAFKMFGSGAEGAAKMMNSYLGELEKTGISGKTAMEVIGGMTAGIRGMSLAQKGFLSAQSGGAGGLQGAFQIEKMLKDGKIDEVFEKVRKQMGKSMGKIVTLEDAEKSPQAAAQMTKQMMMLQQGPLGKFAKDDQSAMRILEAFKARDAGGPVKDLSKSIVQDTMKKGTELQETTNTILGDIRNLIQGEQGSASISNFSTMQHATTARVGSAIDDEKGDYNADMRKNMRDNAHRGEIDGGRANKEFAGKMAGGHARDKSGKVAFETFEEFGTLLGQLGPALKGPLNKMKSLFKDGKDDDAKKEYKAFQSNIQKRKEELKNAPADARRAGLQKIAQEEDTMKSAYATLAVTSGKAGDKRLPNNVPDMDITNVGVGGAADTVSRAANRASSNKSNVDTHAAHTQGQGQQPVNGKISVHVEGYCIACKSKIDGGDQAASVSVGNNVPK